MIGYFPQAQSIENTGISEFMRKPQAHLRVRDMVRFNFDNIHALKNTPNIFALKSTLLRVQENNIRGRPFIGRFSRRRNTQHDEYSQSYS